MYLNKNRFFLYIFFFNIDLYNSFIGFIFFFILLILIVIESFYFMKININKLIIVFFFTKWFSDNY